MTNTAARPRILIVNAHSTLNAGDWTIVLGQLRLLGELAPDADVAITSRTWRHDRPVWAAAGAAAIPPLFSAPTGSGGRWRPWAATLVSLLVPWQALAFLRRLRRADMVLACGGGYFYSQRGFPGLTFWQNYLHVRLAVALRKTVVFLPQSFGPFDNRSSRRLLAGLLASPQVAAVFVRDEVSRACLLDFAPAAAGKIRSCPDMALYHEPGMVMPTGAFDFSDLPRPRLALALRDWDFPSAPDRRAKERMREGYLRAVSDACVALHRRQGASFCLFSQARGPSASEDDRPVARRLLQDLRRRIPDSHLRLADEAASASPAAIVALLRRADLVLTSRLHAAILAILAGTPAVTIGYHHKSLGVLRDLGLENNHVAIEAVRAETLERLCADLLHASREWRASAARGLDAARAKIAAAASPFLVVGPFAQSLSLQRVVGLFVGLLRRELQPPGGSPPEDSPLRRRYVPELFSPAGRLNHAAVQGYAARLAALVREIRRRGAPRLLDAGSGVGSEAILAALLGADVTGIDLTPSKTALAASRRPFYEAACRRPLALRFLVADVIAHLQGEPGYDVIWVNEAISHIHPAEEFAVAAFRSLRPGGVLIIADANALNPVARWRAARLRGARNWYVHRRARISGEELAAEVAEERLFTCRSLPAMLRRAGFRVGRPDMHGFMGTFFLPDSWPFHPFVGALLKTVQETARRVPGLRCFGSSMTVIAEKGGGA
jgi:colanic acid/amylovoran biosynthesis protein